MTLTIDSNSRRAFFRTAAGMASLLPLRARKTYDTRDYGTAGDGTTLDTAAIQAIQKTERVAPLYQGINQNFLDVIVTFDYQRKQ